MNKKRIWLFSDTHGKHAEIEAPKNIDIAICAGDMGTYRNPVLCQEDLEIALEWFNKLDIDTKIYCPGNHDTAMEAGLIEPTQYKWVDIVNHDTIEVDGIKIFCSPYTPYFYDWAYNKVPEQLEELWEDIPMDTDILVTHGPAKDILDRCADGYRAGCPSLRDRINKVKPKIHVFGHIHEDGGKSEEHEGVAYYNASVLNLRYEHSNDGHVIEY